MSDLHLRCARPGCNQLRASRIHATDSSSGDVRMAAHAFEPPEPDPGKLVEIERLRDGVVKRQKPRVWIGLVVAFGLLVLSVLLAGCTSPTSLDERLTPGHPDYEAECVIHVEHGASYSISSWQMWHCDPVTVVTWPEGWEIVR